jgi:hypothetical protein
MFTNPLNKSKIIHNSTAFSAKSYSFFHNPTLSFMANQAITNRVQKKFGYDLYKFISSLAE